VWIYSAGPPLPDLLKGLEIALDSYRPWTGQLHFTKFNPGGNHTERYGRLAISYGTNADPGIEVIVAKTSQSADVLVPSMENRVIWGPNDSFNTFIDSFPPLALHNLVDFQGLPSVIIQITSLDGGGLIVGIKIAHPLADAQSLVGFASDWAMITHSLIHSTPPPAISSVFSPVLLDISAAGNIDKPNPDPIILERAHGLPIHRYDWWASSENAPSWALQATIIPPEISKNAVGDFGSPLKWSNWDSMAPISRCIFRISALQLQKIRRVACPPGGKWISHLDALLAHFWALIMRARETKKDEAHYLDLTVGFRSRVSPPLPKTFIGSPLTLVYAAAVGREADDSLQKLAANIRSTLEKFDGEALSAVLHDMAYDTSSQRYWNAFLGRQNTVVTSWLGLDIYKVDFGCGRASYVDSVMPECDGCLQVMEDPIQRGGKKWYEGDVLVSLHLREDVLKKLIQDDKLYP